MEYGLFTSGRAFIFPTRGYQDCPPTTIGKEQGVKAVSVSVGLDLDC